MNGTLEIFALLRKRKTFLALLPTVLRFRRQPLHRPLQLVYRSEAALLHESWEGDWRDRWSLGPSAPPPDRPAYLLLDVQEM